MDYKLRARVALTVRHLIEQNRDSSLGKGGRSSSHESLATKSHPAGDSTAPAAKLRPGVPTSAATAPTAAPIVAPAVAHGADVGAGPTATISPSAMPVVPSLRDRV